MKQMQSLSILNVCYSGWNCLKYGAPSSGRLVCILDSPPQSTSPVGTTHSEDMSICSMSLTTGDSTSIFQT